MPSHERTWSLEREKWRDNESHHGHECLARPKNFLMIHLFSLFSNPFRPKKGVWNFQALRTPAFIEAGEFQTPFLGRDCQNAGSTPEWGGCIPTWSSLKLAHHFFFVSRKRGDWSSVKSTTSSAVVVLISWCRLNTLTPV